MTSQMYTLTIYPGKTLNGHLHYQSNLCYVLSRRGLPEVYKFYNFLAGG